MKHYFNVSRHTALLIRWIKEWFDENGKDCNAIIGLSGGKDSTIIAKLLCEAIGKDRVIGVGMPDDGQGLNEADKIAEWLGIRFLVADISKSVEAIKNTLDVEWSENTVQNIPPRVRMSVLFAISQTYNGRVVNTCNLSEDYIGYATLFGDAAGVFAPFAKLTVSEIYQIGDHIGIPHQWCHKIPDDGLPHSKPDEEKFGFSYAELDAFIREGHIVSKEKYEKIRKMHNSNLFKIRLLNIPAFEPDITTANELNVKLN